MVYDDEGKLIPMDLCGVFTGKSIEEAKQKAADEFEVRIDQITFRVVNDVKKGLFGKIKEEAKVWAGYNHPVIAEVTVIDSIKAENKLKEQIETCRRYLQNIMEKMGIEAEINIADSEEGFFVDIDSNGSGAIIGRRGETLDALQYLTSLVVNKMDGEYKRITLDSCGYREKREETLIQLAEKISNKALKTGRPTTLEPMNPYERRIIHSAVAKVEGVNSKSVGEEPYRKVVISPDHPKKNDVKKNGGYKKKRIDGPRSLDLKTSFEKDYKKPKPEDDINAGLYGKIEL